MADQARSVSDEMEDLNIFLSRLDPAGDFPDISLADFAGIGTGSDRINLSTLHSSKGREFDVVIMFGMVEGGVPRKKPSKKDIIEACRLFYVGFTRARFEIHLMYSSSRRSRFVTEVEKRLNEAGNH